MATWDNIINGDFISTRVKGPLTQEEFREITDEMLETCKEKQVRKILIDVTETAGSFSQEDAVQFALYASEALKQDIVKYAYVYPHELLTYKSQIVAQGRGLHVRAFYNIDNALEWIEKK